jgi:uncharacterized membrane protein YkvA (DUF1232 family)
MGNEDKRDPADAAKSGFFKSAKKRAKGLLSSPEDIRRLLQDVEKKLESNDKSRLKNVLGDIKTLMALVRAYVKGTYRTIGIESVLLIVAALVYLLNPLDLIPDALIPAGYVDDAAVIAFVISLVKEELDDFRTWDDGGEGGPEENPV